MTILTVLLGVKNQLRRYCKRTTLKVLPRLNSSKTHHGRILWLILFLVLFSGAVICVVLIMTNFLEFNTHVETTVEWGVPSPFPSVTICPHRPLSQRGEESLGSSRSPNWLAQEYEFFAKWYEETYEHRSENNVSTYRLPIPYPSYSQFYQYLPNRTFAQEKGRTLREFIYDCKVNNGTGKWLDCYYFKDVIIRNITNTEYFNCFSITLKESSINTTYGLFLMINLENFLTEASTTATKKSMVKECRQCIRWMPMTWRRGARVTIHEPDTLPDVLYSGYDVSPGSINEMTFRTRLHKLLEPPYGECLNKDHFDIEDKGVYFHYTQVACERVILQKDLKENCSCVDPRLPLRMVDEPKNMVDGPAANYKYPYCEYMPWHRPDNRTYQETWLKNHKCLINARNKFNSKKAKGICGQRCQFYSYDVTVSSTYEFHRSMLLSLYRQLRAKDIIRQEVPGMEDLQSLFNKRKYNDALSLLNTKNDFIGNFAIVQIQRSDQSLTRNAQKESFPLQNLLSMIGGICSLFIGFSVFVFFEIFELIWKIIRMPEITGRENKSANNDVVIHSACTCNAAKKGEFSENEKMKRNYKSKNSTDEKDKDMLDDDFTIKNVYSIPLERYKYKFASVSSNSTELKT